MTLWNRKHPRNSRARLPRPLGHGNLTPASAPNASVTRFQALPMYSLRLNIEDTQQY